MTTNGRILAAAAIALLASSPAHAQISNAQLFDLMADCTIRMGFEADNPEIPNWKERRKALFDVVMEAMDSVQSPLQKTEYWNAAFYSVGVGGTQGDMNDAVLTTCIAISNDLLGIPQEVVVDGAVELDTE